MQRSISLRSVAEHRLRLTPNICPHRNRLLPAGGGLDVPAQRRRLVPKPRSLRGCHRWIGSFTEIFRLWCEPAIAWRVPPASENRARQCGVAFGAAWKFSDGTD